MHICSFYIIRYLWRLERATSGACMEVVVRNSYTKYKIMNITDMKLVPRVNNWTSK